MAVKKVARAETTILDTLLADVQANETVNKRMTEGELVTFVFDNFDNKEIASKNGMLKHLRAEGHSASMSRVFRVYGLVAEAKKQQPTDAN